MPMLPVDCDNMDLSQLREALQQKVAHAFQYPGRGRMVGYADIQGSDYRRLMLQMLDLVEAKMRAVAQDSPPDMRWEFPYDPWVEYEATDEAWARPLGFGHEIMIWRSAT